MTMRKCCGTPKGSTPHVPSCANFSLKGELDVASLDKDVRRAVLDEVGEDLPDGVFFALMGDLGLELEDL